MALLPNRVMFLVVRSHIAPASFLDLSFFAYNLGGLLFLSVSCTKVSNMRIPSLTEIATKPSTPFWLVLIGIILVGVGMGWWTHPGLGMATSGVCVGMFGILLGSD